MYEKLIAEAEELCNKATPGPWEAREQGNSVKSYAVKPVSPRNFAQRGICAGISPKTEDATFIARSRTLIPELVEALKESQRREQAAVEDFESAAHDGGIWCEFCGTDCTNIADKMSDDIWRCGRFTWRGHQGGETDGN